MSAASAMHRDAEVRFLTVEGHKLRIATRAGDGPPLVLATGIGAPLEALLPFVAALPDRAAILFDAPGAGLSPPAPKPMRFAAVAKLVDGLLTELGHETADILGVSWGGGVAQEFARRHSGRCRRLILAATSAGFVMMPGDWRAMAELASPRRYGTPGHMERVAPMIYGGALRHDPELARRCIRSLAGSSPSGYYKQLYATLGWTSAHWLPLLRQPTLVMAGNDDPLVPLTNARLLATLIPRARLQVIEDGHLFLLTQPEAMAQLVDGFLG